MDMRFIRYVRFELGIVEYSLIIALNNDIETGIDQLFGGGRGKSGSSLKLFLFATKPKGGARHVNGSRR